MSGPVNPWLPRGAATPAAAGPVDLPVASAAGPGVPETPAGPAVPQHGVPAPDLVDQLPVAVHHHTAPLWWVGAHGGSGESTLAALAPGWPAAGHAWPRVPGAPSRARVVLAGRTHARGLRAVQKAATQWAAGLVPGVDLVGLVLVADAPGRLPRELRDLAHVVAGGVPRVWRVPWIEAWRLHPDPAGVPVPGEVTSLLHDLRRLVATPSSTSHASLDPKGVRS